MLPPDYPDNYTPKPPTPELAALKAVIQKNAEDTGLEVEELPPEKPLVSHRGEGTDGCVCVREEKRRPVLVSSYVCGLGVASAPQTSRASASRAVWEFVRRRIVG